MNATSSSQAAQRNPNLFTDSSGSPLKVFLDVSGIEKRARVFRTLRTSGAQLVKEVREADIILVNSATDSGLHHVRGWGKDRNKVVLDYSWVEACLEDDRALLEEDDWGGCLAYDDGRSIAGEEEEGLEQEQEQAGAVENTLPSPRQTPSENTGGASKLSKERRKSLAHQPSRSSQVASGSPGPSSTQQTSRAGPASFPMPSQQMPPPGPHQPMPNPMPMHNTSLPSPTQFQMPSPFLQQNMMGMMPPYFYANGMQFPGQVQMPSVASLLETAIAVAHHQNQDTTMLQAVLASFPPYQSNPTPMQPTQPTQPQEPTERPLKRSRSVESDIRNEPNRYNGRHTSSTEDQEKPAPVKRKARASDGTAPTLSRPSHASSSSVKVEKRLGRPYTQTATRSQPFPTPRPSSKASTSTSSQKPLSQTKSGNAMEGVFSSKPPRPFFVQIDLRNRIDVVHAIKRNGGSLSPDIPVASYAILNPRSTTFRDLYGECARFRIPVVLPTFVEECIEEGRLLDPDDYALEIPSWAKPKRGRPSGAKSPAKSQPRKKEATPAPQEESEGEGEVEVKGQDRSVTPEAPQEAVFRTNGLAAFTEEEWEFCWMYARRILAKDSSLTMVALAKKLHDKMPQHSARSWEQAIHKKSRTFHEIRAEAAEASKRGGNKDAQPTENEDDAEAEAQSEDAAPPPYTPSVEETSTAGVTTATTTATPVDPSQLQEDFETIVNFLVSGDVDNDPEDEIWARLSEMRVCQSAPSWDQFLDGHIEEITAEVERRVHPADNAGLPNPNA
ncbi:hypothetical protein EVG20_g124 [Dentipellis fragilis]|uniref:BRCT domain-containing protein n=1 Tax=Dentipellis fragilis TaxID=205917 RepID=A0A4Y9ZHA9_9AGAM|nr:hypothetical protein EVG20_g124 [Dentipellis fragilis]